MDFNHFVFSCFQLRHSKVDSHTKINARIFKSRILRKPKLALCTRTQVQEQRGRDLAEAVENAQSGKAVEYERLQQEFADYKRRVNLLVQEREYALQEARAKLSRTRNGSSDGKVVSDSELSNVTAPSPSTWFSVREL